MRRTLLLAARVRGANSGYFTRIHLPALPLSPEALDPGSCSAAALAQVRIVLVRTTHPGNIGAAARAMHTMGLAQLILVAPEHFPDPQATARATGATEVLADARVVSTLSQALAGCAWAVGLSARPRAFAGRALALRDAACEALQHTVDGDVAFVFGTEMSGLSNDELRQCAAAATIPANPEFSSLNLAAAVQVAAYEVRVAAGANRVWAAPRFAGASHDEVEALYAHAASTLAALRFLDPARPRQLMPRLRRLFGRADLEREEVNILRGILARVDQFVARGLRR
ncbi:MAG: RNA methyltransferase [Burkholderiales bacterium]|nr:RNA methyltransferase [Burkholderiales bacterium]